MEYLLSHDEYTEVIATESRNWANAVFRKEDMKLYVLAAVVGVRACGG